MNERERALTIILLVFILVAGGGSLGYFLYWKPLQEREGRLAILREEVRKRREEVQQIQRDLPRLELWKNQALPADQNLALREYERFLAEILRESGFEPGKFTIKPQRAAESRAATGAAGKSQAGPGYSRLTFTVQTNAPLNKIVAFLERFYHTSLLHQIRGLTLTRTTDSSRTKELRVDLTIEALILPAPESKARPAAFAVLGSGVWAARFGKAVTPGGLAVPLRDYAAVAANNIFLGVAPPAPVVEGPPVDRTHLTNFILLTSITQGEEEATASLNYLYNNKRPQVQCKPKPDTFAILEDSRGRAIIEGAVLGMTERDLYFRVQLALPREGGSRFRSRDADSWSRPDQQTLGDLVRSEVVHPDEADRVYQISKSSWEQLDREELVDLRGANFTFRWDLLSGQVLRSDERTVTILVNEKFCAYASASGNQEGRGRRRMEPHAGYFAWHVGEPLDQAMAAPLDEEQVKKFQKTAAMPTKNDAANP